MVIKLHTLSILCLFAVLYTVEGNDNQQVCFQKPGQSVNPSCETTDSSGVKLTTSEDETCSVSERQQELDNLRIVFVEEINNDEDLLPAFVRAAFHDCFTATTDKPDSGCNGSLRLAEELDNPDNDRLASALTAIENALEGYPCTSVADGIQLASAVANTIAGGPDVISDVVNAETPRVDAAEADNMDGELPSSTSDFETLVELYERKGFNSDDLISSSAGAHSLGGFRNPPVGIAPFTTDRLSVSSGYAYNLIQRRQTGENMDGFNTLDSDVALISNTRGVRKLREFAGCTEGVRECERNDQIGTPILNEEFAIFLVKLSRMTGNSVGNSTILSEGLSIE